jgi:CheY-like chemotaxis protein
MDEATTAQIFEPFFTTKPVDKGTGLSLATVYGIVKQSGGAIDVVSAPGQGAAFNIYLPYLGQEPAKTGWGTRALPLGTGTVLLVEDEPAVRSFSSLALRSAGYTVLEAQNGDDAIAVSRKHPQPIDLLATDVVMPKMNGGQLAEYMTSKQPNLKVLFMSGNADDAVVRLGVKDAGLAFLQKPFTPSVLVRKVHEVLGR